MSTRRGTKFVFRREFLMSHATTNSIPSSNFNKSNEENSRYPFHFIEHEKNVKELLIPSS